MTIDATDCFYAALDAASPDPPTVTRHRLARFRWRRRQLGGHWERGRVTVGALCDPPPGWYRTSRCSRWRSTPILTSLGLPCDCEDYRTVPSLAERQRRRRRLQTGVGLGFALYATGVVLAAFFHTHTALVSWTLTLVGAALLFGCVLGLNHRRPSGGREEDLPRCDFCTVSWQLAEHTIPWRRPLTVLSCQYCAGPYLPDTLDGWLLAATQYTSYRTIPGLVTALQRARYPLHDLPVPLLDALRAHLPRVLWGYLDPLGHRWALCETRYRGDDGRFWRRLELGPVRHRHTILVPVSDAPAWDAATPERPYELAGGVDAFTGETIEHGYYVAEGRAPRAEDTHDQGRDVEAVLGIVIREVPNLYEAGAAWAAGGPILDDRPESDDAGAQP